MSNVRVEVERPVTIEANGKKLRLSHEEAKDLANKLCQAIGYYPWQYHYPYITYTGNNTPDQWYYSTTSDTIKVTSQ